MQSRVRVWKGGRVAFPEFWKYVLQMSNRWSLQHKQPFQAGLLTLQACQVFETVRKALMMRSLVPICSLSTTNNYPRECLNECWMSVLSWPLLTLHTSLILLHTRGFFGNGWIKCLDTWRYLLSFDTPAFRWTNVSDGDWNLCPGDIWEL